MARTTRARVELVRPANDFDLSFTLPAGIEQRSVLRLAVMGISPLLTHNAMAMLAPKQTRGSNIPTPEEEAEAGVYRDAEGHFCLPGVAFQRSFLEAASAFRAPKGKLSMQSYLAHIEVAEELMVLLDPTTKEPLTEYEIDRRTAVVQRNRILRCRPKFNVWAGLLTIRYDAQLIGDPGIICAIGADAGTRRGVGDYRPGKSKGPFGRFAVIAFAYGETGPWQRYEPGAAAVERLAAEEESDEAQ